MSTNFIFITCLLLFITSEVSLDGYDHHGTFKNITQDEVGVWASSIGKELLSIGTRVTNLEDIKRRYGKMKALVKPTDGNTILKTIVSRMNKFIKEKVDAVMSIKNASVKAESAFTSLNMKKHQVQYRNSKFSDVTVNSSTLNISEPFEKSDKYLGETLVYKEMTLSPDPRFNDVLVNTTYSSVHVPTNIFDRWDKVIEPIYWSEILDETFRMNYEKDSSLMWQYYASTSGFLRHFPAFRWSMNPDKYDCRKRIWYIQAATCSKEVVVLIDNSGTMYGMRNTIAQLTVDSLLQTFSNNDYVNIFRLYDDNETCLVPCFNDTLIQATPENVELFKQALYAMCPDKKISFRRGFKKAFEMLHSFMKNKTEQTERRNQAIFLLTDMLPSQTELDNIRKDYDRIYNDTNIQVELFIYFIGKDVPEIREVQWEKCLRNGSIVHVRTMDEVPEDVLKYLPVIARTQNENTENYPISWTHVFLDIKRDKGKPIDSKNEENEEEVEVEDEHNEYGKLSEPRIMTSVTAPVYSVKQSLKLALGREEMIGVAAIDVPVTDFEKLTMPHKIGVNGYAFIVTNNGYLLSHPNLTPVKDGTFRENFNSVDLTEVEFYDDNENEPRKPNENIVELRRRMVNQEVGNMTDMPIKFHYDNQKRVGSELRNYFFAPLRCSPFTLGLALPRGYGNYWIKTFDEIEVSKIKEENYSNYFIGDWTIHPKWTYCDYRDEKKYNYKNPKEKLLDFFGMIFDDSNTFEWSVEHPGEDINNLTFTDSFESCFANDTTKKPAENYFCDKELMQLLFFDAKLTHAEFVEDISEKDKEFMSSKRIRLKFVATQSGLTRWKYFLGNDTGGKSFGETNNKALDEIWYKSAVLLHELNVSNFVFSPPKEDNTGKKYITASHAIFHKDEENEAPGIVVGYEIAYETINELMKNINGCNGFQKDCFIIDANGYVVYAKESSDLGKFFGEVEGAVMEKMITLNIFRKLSMHDYQAFTNKTKTEITSRGSFLFNPFSHLIWMTKWALTKILWILVETNLWPYVQAPSSCSSVVSTNYKTLCQSCKETYKTCPLCCKAPKKYSDVSCQTREIPAHIERLDDDGDKPKKIPVDKSFFLYLYTNLSAYDFILDKNAPNENCSRPFFLSRIPDTNLMLILVDTSHQTCYKNLNVNQEVIRYKSAFPDIPACNKKMISSYPRKKLRGCSDKMLENRKSPIIEVCGSTRIFNNEFYLIFICNVLLYILNVVELK